RVRREIDIFAVEHDPFAIRRRHRRAEALEFHHVFKGEGMFSWRWLRENRAGEDKTESGKNLHKLLVLFRHSERSRGISDCFLMSEISRDVSTSVDMTVE